MGLSMCHVAGGMYLSSVDRLVSSSLATRWLLQVFLDPSFGHVSHLRRTLAMGDGMMRLISNFDPIFLFSPLFPWSLVPQLGTVTTSAHCTRCSRSRHVSMGHSSAPE